MGLFDAFTGDPANSGGGSLAQLSRHRAEQSRQRDRADARSDRATAARRIRRTRAAISGPAMMRQAARLRAGAGNALGYIDDGMSGAAQSLQGARDALTANGGAYAPLGELADRYGEGSRLYADALGINGAEGAARARAAFQGGPGWETQLDTSLDALNRRRNAAGSLFSGNADADAIKLGSDYADQGWKDWLAGLSGYNPLELNATSANATGNAGDQQHAGQSRRNRGEPAQRRRQDARDDCGE